MTTQTKVEFQATLEERTKQFNEAREEVKEQFIGIEEVIEKIFAILKQWFLLPETITQPVIINLIGMSGTGKTSLVRAIAKALDIGRFAEIDIPKTQNIPVTHSIKNLLGNNALIEADKIPLIILCDEFDKAPTRDANGDLKEPTANRDLWTLLSDGKVTSDEARLFSGFQEIVKYMYKHKIPLNLLHIANDSMIGSDPQELDYVLELVTKTKDLGVKEYLARLNCVPGISPERKKAYIELTNLISRYNVYTDGWSEAGTKIGRLYNNLTRLVRHTEFEITLDEFEKFTTESLLSFLKEIKEAEVIKDYYNLSKSVFFTCSNLDRLYHTQALGIRSIDADLLRELSGKITTVQIKNCLSTLFGPEQVARLGNTLIAYPTFSSENYRTIIRQKLDQFISLIDKECHKFTLTIDPSLEKLIYKNGVYPTQGTRPIYSTLNHIQSLFGQLIFEVLQGGKENSGTLTYNPDERLIVIQCPSGYTSSVEYIGDYDPSKKVIDDNHLARNSVNMAAKLIGYLSLFGILPKKVVASCSNREADLFLTHKYVPSEAITFKMIVLELMEQAGQNVIFGDSASIEPSTSATAIASRYIRLQGQGANKAVMNSFSPELGLINSIPTDSEIEKLVGKGYKEALVLTEKYFKLIKSLAIVIYKNEGEISPEEIESAIVGTNLFVQRVSENYQISENYRDLLFREEVIQSLTSQINREN